MMGVVKRLFLTIYILEKQQEFLAAFLKCIYGPFFWSSVAYS